MQGIEFSMTNKKEGFSIAEVSSALNEEDRTDVVVNALKRKCLSQVEKRVEYLEAIQAEHDALVEERAACEAKYQKSIQSLYTKRYKIVNGITEVEGVTNETTAEAEEKGVPSFWLNAMKNNDFLAEEITECDKGALKYLKDIEWTGMKYPEGFMLKFSFESNPYFLNSDLTKTFLTVNYEPKEAIGTKIEWFPEKCLTRTVFTDEPKKSFFNFFKQPEVLEYSKDIDEEVIEQLQYQLEYDYAIGVAIRDKIIPCAVSWFTKEEAARGKEFGVLDSSNKEDEGEEETKIKKILIMEHHQQDQVVRSNSHSFYQPYNYYDEEDVYHPGNVDLDQPKSLNDDSFLTSLPDDSMYQSIMSADLIVPDFTVDHNPTTWNQGVGNPFVESGETTKTKHKIS
ncbi:unnamed protein product [Trifolium pratense]|uniref:Uncharacterized protein n=1 Tax=Trifolium pratense TaxID=57577 RepID=A0ACB0KJE8_TRIPR|nr:unnamed protein product [Trifolium pratense]